MVLRLNITAHADSVEVHRFMNLEAVKNSRRNRCHMSQLRFPTQARPCFLSLHLFPHLCLHLSNFSPHLYHGQNLWKPVILARIASYHHPECGFTSPIQIHLHDHGVWLHGTLKWWLNPNEDCHFMLSSFFSFLNFGTRRSVWYIHIHKCVCVYVGTHVCVYTPVWR